MGSFVLSSPNILSTVFLGLVLVVCWLYHTIDPRSKYLGKFAWVGRGSGYISAIRGNLNSVNGMYAMAFDGYNKVDEPLQLDFWASVPNFAQFSKHGVPFAIPSLQSGPVIMLPQTVMHEALSAPEIVLDVRGLQNSFIHMEYTIGDTRVGTKDVHHNLMKRHLNKQLPWLLDSMHDELRSAIEDILPESKTETNELVMFETWMKIVVRVICRQCVGVDLCRDRQFLQLAESFSLSIFAAAALIDQTPSWFRPIVGPIFSIPAQRKIKDATRQLTPTIKSRIEIAQKIGSGAGKQEVPNDFLQWLVESAIKNNDPEELEFELITRRLLLILMSAIHTPTTTMTAAFCNMWRTENYKDMVARLREESDKLYESYGYNWTKENIDQLHLADSLFRESLRFTPQLLIGVPRRVVAPEGITFPNGITIPQGPVVAFPVDPIHRDNDNFPDADRFVPFRFANTNTTSEAEKRDRNQTNSKFNGVPMTTLSDDFFGFGHGRHACPGRFFGSMLMKMMLAHVVGNYDIELKGDPRGANFFGLSIPSRTVRMILKPRHS